MSDPAAPGDEGRPELWERVLERRVTTGMTACFRPGWRPADLVAFHTTHKLIVLAHDEARYRELGRLVAAAGVRALPELEAAYRAGVGDALGCPATPGRHCNVLQHLAGHLKGHLDPPGRHQIEEAIDTYVRGSVGLRLPVGLLRAAAEQHGVSYLLGQAYLAPEG